MRRQRRDGGSLWLIKILARQRQTFIKSVARRSMVKLAKRSSMLGGVGRFNENFLKKFVEEFVMNFFS